MERSQRFLGGYVKMIKLDYDTALRLLEEVVAGNEDLIYEMPTGKTYCSYAAGGNTQGCGVGQVFRRAGVRTLDLVRFDYVGGVKNLTYSIKCSEIVNLDRQAATLLAAFQSEQDLRATWGWALNYAKDVVND